MVALGEFGKLRITHGAVLVLAACVGAFACLVAPPSSSADGGSTSVIGEVIPGGMVVDPSGTPAVAGTDNSCHVSIISGCLVIGNPSASNFAPLTVSDGFNLQSPVPVPWQGLEQSAEATIANLRGVPADRRNRNWARPEINASMFLDLIGLIHKKADGETLTDAEQADLDVLATAYQTYEKNVADRALRLYDEWAADPCDFLVPVGTSPRAYLDSLGTTCAGPVLGTIATVPPPKAEQFTEWARELVGDDLRRSLVPQVLHFSQVSGAPAMTADEADAEIALEYQNAIGSLEKGFSFLAAAAHVAANAPTATQPEAAGEVVDEIKEATTEHGTDRFVEAFGDVIESSVKLVGPFREGFFGIEQQAAEALQNVSGADKIGYDTPIGPYTEVQQELVDLITEELESAEFEAEMAELFAEGIEIGGVVIGAAEVITAEAIQVGQDINVLPTLQSNRDEAYATPDLEELTQTSEGWAKLENAFVNELMPDFTFRKLREPAPDGAAPAASVNDPQFQINPDGAPSQITTSPSILVDDWARPGMPQAISVGNGWVTRRPLDGVASDNVALIGGAPTPGKDVLGQAVSDTTFNYIDPNGDWWRAWPVRGSMMQVRFAKRLTGDVSVYRYLSQGIPSEIPCHDNSFGFTVTPKNNGFSCVVGSGTHFASELAAGDFVMLGDEVKKVDHVFSDTAFTTTSPFKGSSGAFEPIDVGSSVVKIVSGDENCFSDGNCRYSDSVDYESSRGSGSFPGFYTATIGDRPPVIAPSITGTLHSGPVQIGQTCDPQGNCTTPSVPTWSFAPGEQLTLDTHAFDPDAGDSIRILNWDICDDETLPLCTIIGTAPGSDGNGLAHTFDHAGTWSVDIFAVDQSGKRTEVTTTLKVRKADQEITDHGAFGFPAPDPVPRYGKHLTLVPLSSSGLPVDVTSDTPSVCTATGTHGTTITYVGVGHCAIEEAQPGNATYNAAPSLTDLSFPVFSAVAIVTASPSVQYSDQLPNLNVLGSVSGLVGTDQLAGALTGCTAATVTTTAGNVTSPAGAYALTGCSGLSGANYIVDYTGSLTVTPEDATITSTTPELVATAGSTTTTAAVPLSATVAQAADGHLGDLTNAHVDFLIWSSTNTTATPSYTVANVAANASGIASTSLSLPAGAYRLVVRLSNHDFFTGVGAMDSVLVFQPQPGLRESGAGWVTDSSAGGNHKSHFAFNLANASNGAPSGAATFSWIGSTDGYAYTASCSNWSGGGFRFSGTGVSATCVGTVTAVNLSTGQVVAGIGGSGYSIVLNATDNGSGGKSDTFSALVKAPGGATVHNLSGAGGAQVTIGGGNITFQKK